MECLFLRDWSFVLLLLLPWSVSGKFTVIGPQQPIIALVGGEAIFQCHLSPQMDAQDMDVMWFYGESSQIVHHYKNRQDYLKYQHQDYKGRTEFLRDHIFTGSVALKLHRIRPSDEGKYRCFFESFSGYEEAEYQVYVGGKGSAPHIYFTSDGNKSFKLICTSTGWYPKPEVHWRKNQEKLLSKYTTIKKKENGLFSVETSIMVSNNSTGNISCFIWNPLLRQKLEASVSVSDDLFQHNTPWRVIWIVTVVLLSIVIFIIIFVIWKLKKVKDKEERASVHKSESGESVYHDASAGVDEDESAKFINKSDELGTVKDESDELDESGGVDKDESGLGQGESDESGGVDKDESDELGLGKDASDELGDVDKDESAKFINKSDELDKLALLAVKEEESVDTDKDEPDG